VLAGPPLELPELLGELPRGLDGLAAAGGEEHPVQVAGSVLGQPLGEVDRLRVRVGPQREEPELGGLLTRPLGELDAPVPGLHDEQPGQAVDVPAALVVPDVVALAAHDRGDLVLPGALPGEVPPEVVAGGGVPVGAARGAGAGQGVGHRVPQL
jgi:hypothetical protein